MKQILLVLICFAFAKAYSQSTTKDKGAIIPQFGNTYDIQNPDFKTDTSASFKVVFDVSKAPEDPSQLNPYLNTIARFLNMHYNAGVPIENLQVRTAIHGPASYGLLENKFYKEKFGVDNPNLKLLKALDEAGVELILCGQTAEARNINSARRLKLIDIALSAMTILSQSQMDGFALIAF